MSNPVGWITVAETLAALEVLEPRTSVSVDQLHYWDRVGVVPVKRAKRGRAPLYSTQDLALCRVIARLLMAGAVPQHVTVALRYRRQEVCDALRKKGPKDARVLYIDRRGVGHVVRPSAVPEGTTWRVDLQDCWRGVSKQMRVQREKRPSVLWDGRRNLKAGELVAA